MGLDLGYLNILLLDDKISEISLKVIENHFGLFSLNLLIHLTSNLALLIFECLVHVDQFQSVILDQIQSLFLVVFESGQSKVLFDNLGILRGSSSLQFIELKQCNRLPFCINLSSLNKWDLLMTGPNDLSLTVTQSLISRMLELVQLQQSLDHSLIRLSECSLNKLNRHNYSVGSILLNLITKSLSILLNDPVQILLK